MNFSNYYTWIGDKEERTTMKEEIFETVDCANDSCQELDSFEYCKSNRQGVYLNSDDDDDMSDSYIGYNREPYLDDEDDENLSERFDERKLNENRYMNESSKYHFFKQEEQSMEPFRTKLNLMYKKDGKNYTAIVMKELDKKNFVFLISERTPEGNIVNRMKKFHISDVSVYF